ncbi:MAG: nucleotidyltransferase domain-containing protein [Fibrobacterota bacterium]
MIKNQLVTVFNDNIPVSIRNRILKIIVFGSYARGDSAPDSDLDVAVIVDRKDAFVEKLLEDAAYQAMLDTDFKTIISVKVFSDESFNACLQKGFAFYRHIADEGVVV